MTAPPLPPPISPNRQHSHLQDLPISSPILNRTNSARSSIGYDDPRMATLAAATHLTLPFPRQTSSEFFRNTTPSPATSPLSGPASSSPPTWPNPASYTFSPTSKTSVSPTSTSSYSTMKSTGLQPGKKLICFELALGDRLAARLDGETTLQSIKEASGVLSTEITEDEGPKRLISTGSASAVQKARQLVDAKLSQTPIRTLVGIKVPPSTSSLTFTPTIGPHVSRFQPVSASTYRLVTSSSPPTNHSPLPSQAFAPRPDLLSYPSTTSAISDFSLPPSHQQPSATSPAPLTPSSEKSSDSFFTVRENSPTPSPPCRSPGPSRGLTMTLASLPDSAPTSTATVVEDERSPPQIGCFEDRREAYIEAMVDELEGAVKRRSLVRVKLDIGSQEWRREGKDYQSEKEFETERWSLEEVEKWKTDSLSLSTTSPSSPVSPLFATSLSHSTSLQLLSTLVSHSPLHSSFSKKAEISQVHILHLDKSRASFGCAIADCRGQELRNLPSKGTPASGTLVLKKCSTLPSKPFALSIVSPPSSNSTVGQQRDGCDLRLNILADKAATSPSLDLSAAMQSATWELDDFGEFRVSVNLKEERFGKGETEIRWISRERWENSDGSLRFTLSEQRYSESSKHDHSVELCSPALNQLLADYALDQAQGKKGRWERDKVRGWVEELVEFGEGLVEHDEVDEVSEEIASGLVLGTSA